MNQDHKPSGDFEGRLLAELRAIVAGREPAEHEVDAASPTPRRRRGRRLAVAGSAVTAVAAVALIVGAGGSDTPVAYAVTPHDGKLNVEIRRLGDPDGLQRALGAAGVPADVEYELTEAACEAASGWQVEGTEATVPTVPAEAARLTIDPSEVGPGETLVITAAPAGEGIAVETTVAELEPESVEGASAEDADNGGEETGANCAASTEASAAAPTVPAVPAEDASEPGVPASR